MSSPATTQHSRRGVRRTPFTLPRRPAPSPLPVGASLVHMRPFGQPPVGAVREPPFPLIPYRPPGDSESPTLTIPTPALTSFPLLPLFPRRACPVHTGAGTHLSLPRRDVPSGRPSPSSLTTRLVIPNPRSHVIPNLCEESPEFRPPHTLSSQCSAGNLAGFHSPSRPTIPRRRPIPKPTPSRVGTSLVASSPISPLTSTVFPAQAGIRLPS